MLAALSAVAFALGLTLFATANDTPPAAPSAESAVCQPDYWGC